MTAINAASATAFPSPTPNAAIYAQNLVHKYQTVTAVAGIDLDVQTGEIFGLIGPDGAGKTTTFHILGGVMQPTSGDVLVMGIPPRQGRLNIGYLTQQFSLYLDLSIEENLRYSAGLRQVPANEFEERAPRLLEQMDLARFKDRLAGQLSGGMKQKLALCCSLISRPAVLLLDEPTTGVDPVSRREFWDLLAEVAAEGVTIAVATPYLDEAERCNRVALIYDGKIEKVGTVKELKDGLGLKRLEVRSSEIIQKERSIVAQLDEEDGPREYDSEHERRGFAKTSQRAVVDVQSFGDRLDVLAQNVQEARTQIERVCANLAVSDITINVDEPTLENVFVTTLRQRHGSLPKDELVFNRPPLKKMGNSGITAQNICKQFGSFNAVRNVSLNVNYGEIYGLLGANGAGKTTTIKMLCGLISPSSGTMMLAGKSSDLRNPKLRERIGYMSQKFTLYDDLTVLENLQFYCGVYEVPMRLRNDKIKAVLATSELTGQGSMLTGKLPGGWKQRLSFGACVMHEPEILFLDEPTSGVDPLARRQLWVMIADLARHGTAVLVTTHFLEEAEHCHQLGFMVAGKLVAQGTPSSIKSDQPGQLIELTTSENQRASNLLKSEIDAWRVSIFADRLHVVLDDAPSELPKIKTLLQTNNVRIINEQPVPFSLEDAFIGIVQRAAARARS